MSEEGLQPVATRFQAVNVRLALNETYNALAKMFPGIHCDVEWGHEDYQVSFSMGNPETFNEFVAFLYKATMHANMNLIPKKIIYNPPATIVLWEDGTKTVVKCSKHDSWNAETGFLWALAEKLYGSKSQVEKVINRHAEFNY